MGGQIPIEKHYRSMSLSRQYMAQGGQPIYRLLTQS